MREAVATEEAAEAREAVWAAVAVETARAAAVVGEAVVI